MSLPRRPSSTLLRLPAKTLADWLAIGIGPVLIMLMVGSLVFFLAQVGYRGGFSGQVHWTLFWFTLASVLVSRISIENGSAYGSIYGLALGAATAFRMIGFLGAPWGALVLLGVIWWCASKLTWDCTVIDDDEDASGEGLLQHAGFEEDGRGAEDGVGVGASKQKLGAPPKRGPGSAVEPAPRPHAPGLWVIYVALGALPVFGFGQWMIPVADEPARLRGFLMAGTFVTAALALLLTSSFLGLRRYLRQRHLTMPPAIARSWVVLGTFMLAAVLLGAALLPRPRGLETLAGLGFGLRDRSPKASAAAWMEGEAATGEGRAIGKSGNPDAGAGKEEGEGATPGELADGPGREGGKGRSAEGELGAAGSRDGKGRAGTEGTGREAADAGGESSGDREDGGGGIREGGAAAGSQGGESRSGRTSPGGRSARVEAPPPPPVPPAPTGILALLRIVSWLLGLLVVGWLLFRFGRQWLQALRRAWPEKKKAVPGPGKSPRRTPMFPSFPDPFASGRAEGMSPEQLTLYTFEALEAWAGDAGRERRPEETPFEFGEALVRRSPEWEEDLRGAARGFAAVVYGGRKPSEEAVDRLRRLWGRLRPG